MISAIGRRPASLAHREAENSLFGYGGVARSGAELLAEPDRRLEHAARLGDVFAKG